MGLPASQTCEAGSPGVGLDESLDQRGWGRLSVRAPRVRPTILGYFGSGTLALGIEAPWLIKQP